MEPDGHDTEALIRLARAGDDAARQALLARQRTRLRRMVAVRMDRRVLPRVDPSDVVQDAMADAWEKLGEYLESRPVPFYPWLRQIAWRHLVDLHRRHVLARKRAVGRETHERRFLPEESSVALVSQLLATGTSPSGKLVRAELRDRVRAALDALRENDREVLVLRYLEHLSMAEIAAVLEISESAAKVRHLRALQRIQEVLTTQPGGASK
jgi:RNA polymerase sigma-70 factor (ECF subfamily)